MFCMYCLGDLRNATFSPRAKRSRSRWRIFSRSSATAFIRLFSESVASSGMASVSTVAIAATAANTVVITRGFWTLSIRMSSMAVSEIEVDHSAHHEHAHRHPDAAQGQHEAAGRRGPQAPEVWRAGEVDGGTTRERT